MDAFTRPSDADRIDEKPHLKKATESMPEPASWKGLKDDDPAPKEEKKGKSRK